MFVSLQEKKYVSRLISWFGGGGVGGGGRGFGWVVEGGGGGGVWGGGGGVGGGGGSFFRGLWLVGYVCLGWVVLSSLSFLQPPS